MGLTITKIAKELKISPATVSKALNDREGIGNSLKLKIQKFAEERGYRPYINARETGMYNQKINIINVFYSHCADPFVIKKIQEGIESVFYNSKFDKFHFLVNFYYHLNSKEKRELALRSSIMRSNLIGIIFSFIDVSEQLLNFLQKKKVSCVLLNHYTEIGRCVYIDEIKTMYKVVRKLIYLGRKNIGILIPGEMDSYIWNSRIKGYIRALKEKRIKYNPELIVYVNSDLPEDFKIAVNRIINKNPRLDALIFSDYIQAINGIKILKDLKRKIPEEIAVLNFGNINYNILIDPELSSVEIPLFEMGQRGAKLLVNSIIKHDLSYEAVQLNSKIIFRKSCSKESLDKKH